MKRLSLIVLVLILSIQAFSQTFTQKADSLMSEIFEDNGPGGIALVMKGDEILYRKAFGLASLELDVKMTPANIIRIGSITKTFTATAILKLAEERKLDLQDPISKYIQDYPTQGEAITIEHLLTHTSGIKDFINMESWTDELRKMEYTPQKKIDLFKNEPMEFMPGDEFHYNNSGYILLGYIIEIVSGMQYDEYIDTFFFNPLGMENSFYESTSDIIRNRARGYAKNGKEYKNADFLDMSNPYAAGAIISTVDDILKWYKAVLQFKVIMKASLLKAHSPYKLNNGNLTDYGYGWELHDIQEQKAISHSGGITGFLTNSIYLPENDLFIIVFSNCTCNGTSAVEKKLIEFALEK